MNEQEVFYGGTNHPHYRISHEVEREKEKKKMFYLFCFVFIGKLYWIW